MHGLQVPSGSETGLKLVSGFTVPDGGVVDYTIDFDLRQAINCPPGQSPACILKPAQRLVQNTQMGNIQGSASATSQTPFYYQFTFLDPGAYTVAFTCQADQDNPDQADAAVTFSPVKTAIMVTANMTATADLP